MKIFATVEMQVKYLVTVDAITFVKEIEFRVPDDMLIEDVVDRAKSLARRMEKSPVLAIKMKDVTLLIKEGE